MISNWRHWRLLGASVGAAAVFIVVGIVFWGGFHTVLAATNTMTFCISCHEMEENVYQEYVQTIHYKNPSGVRATCPDCHVPKEWHHMIVRKISATNELFHKLIGTIDTPEKFGQQRLRLATTVWHSLAQSDSRECRNCHDFTAMAKQTTRAALVHRFSQSAADPLTTSPSRNKTCIDCHKGIAHHLPEGIIPYKGGDDNDHAFYQRQKVPCYQCHLDMSKPQDDW